MIAEEQASAVGTLTQQKAALEAANAQQEKQLELCRSELAAATASVNRATTTMQQQSQQSQQSQSRHQSTTTQQQQEEVGSFGGGGDLSMVALSASSKERMNDELQYSRLLAEGRATEVYELQMVVTALEAER